MENVSYSLYVDLGILYLIIIIELQILLYHVLEKMFPDSNPAACSSMSLEGRCFVDLRYYLEHNSDCTRYDYLIMQFLESLL